MTAEQAPPTWRPTASFDALRRRAKIAASIRRFFDQRGVLEVETPTLGAAPAPDPHLASLETRVSGGETPDTCYLQTSPEHAMKRLLAAGSGPIYQLGRAYRDGETGSRHNPEFTLLEWYRPGFSHHDLMDEVEVMLREILALGPAEKLSYADAFERHLGLDPHHATAAALAAAAERSGIDVAGLEPVVQDDDAVRDDWLHLLLATVVEPRLGRDRNDGPAITFLFDFPASQAALARVRPGPPAVAERFEVFVAGVELANGFHELTDATEQRRRFVADNRARHRLGLPAAPLDERLLAALEAGMPPCAGVALGFDRLVMLAVGATRIDEVLAFPIARA